MSTRSGGASNTELPWTCPDVELWLKAAFRAMPYTPIFAPRGNTLHAFDPNVPDASFDIVAFTGTVLGDRSVERVILLFWARVMATRGEVGTSIAEFCRENSNLDRRQFDRLRKRACQKVADAKNRVNQRGRSAA